MVREYPQNHTNHIKLRSRSTMRISRPSTADKSPPLVLRKGDPAYPATLIERLGDSAPSTLFAMGNIELLSLPKTALFCSRKYPGSVILPTYDQAAKWRDTGRCVIGGFHSPIESECLRILLRGKQPIIICPARSLPKVIPPEWRQALSDNRLLILSAFPQTDSRPTASLAERRNQLVAALADEAYFAHITPTGTTARLATRVTESGIPIMKGPTP